MNATLAKCLADIGLTKPAEQLANCDTLENEFVKIKTTYFRAILRTHPDKGGDPDEFRKVQVSFELLREAYEKRRITSFLASSNSNVNDTDVDLDWEGERTTWQEWFAANPKEATADFGFYEEAARESVPLYKVELARSGRSKCRANKKGRRCTSGTNDTIEKDTIRIGRLDKKSGGYTRWSHLACWAVPSKVWLGLDQRQGQGIQLVDVDKVEMALLRMNEVVLCGFRELGPEDRRAFCWHVMERNHWADVHHLAAYRNIKTVQVQKNDVNVKMETEASNDVHATTSVTLYSDSKQVKMETEAPTTSMTPYSSSVVPHVESKGQQKDVKMEIAAPNDAYATTSVTLYSDSKAMTVKTKKRFNCTHPKPGSLLNQRVVLTGLFPEVGGGTGLNLGKDRTKALVEAAGGRVTAAVSGKTNLLLVGKEPGMSKVNKARSHPKCALITLAELEPVLEGNMPLKQLMEYRRENPLLLDAAGFSAGYGGNSLALTASGEEMAIATGNRVVVAQIEAPKMERASPGKKNAPKKTKAKKATVVAKAKRSVDPTKKRTWG